MQDYKYHIKYPFIGVLLAQGAPVGALLIKSFENSFSLDFWQLEITRNFFFYCYMTISTSVVFALYGFVLGKAFDKMAEEKQIFYEESVKDPLTNLYNRRYFDQIIKQEFSRSSRFKASLSCLILDIDFFKKVNDNFGHAIGDKVLIAVADILQKFVREYDTVARYGGEEFVILLPNTTSREALAVAEKIRKEIENQNVLGKVGIKNVQNLTVSIGGASLCRETMETPQSLVSRADTALYRSKEKGRNRVTI